MERSIKTTREDFDFWLADMDDALARFTASLPGEIRDKLDYSPESLDVLERWLLSKYPDTKSALPGSEAKTLDGAARYIGETFRKHLGGHWDIELESQDSVEYNIPAIVGYREKAGAITPLTLATAAADRRTGSYIRNILERQIARKQKI